MNENRVHRFLRELVKSWAAIESEAIQKALREGTIDPREPDYAERSDEIAREAVRTRLRLAKAIADDLGFTDGLYFLAPSFTDAELEPTREDRAIARALNVVDDGVKIIGGATGRPRTKMKGSL